MATREEWETAARAHGLEVVAEPTCPKCGGSGEEVDHHGYGRTCECEGEFKPRCPVNLETFEPGAMAWVKVAGFKRPVSALSQVGCGLCGERPARPGSDCCAECLESAPTMRGVELESMGGAL